MLIHIFIYTSIDKTLRVWVCWLLCICAASVQEVEGAASHGVFCGMPLLAPSQIHEMGKHEIKVEKPHKGVEGGWLGSGWGYKEEGEGGMGGLSLHPRPRKALGLPVPWKEPLWGPGCSACIGLKPQTQRLPTQYIYVLFYHSLPENKQPLHHVLLETV